MTPSRPFHLDLLHLFALSAFAVAQPLFDLLGRYATFFVAHAARPRDVVLFALVLCVAPPAALGLLELAVGLVSARARRGLHLGLVALLVAAIALPPLHRAVALAPLPAFGLALAAGALAAVAYARAALARSFASALSPAVLVFPGLFLFHSPAAALVWPAPDAAAAAVAVRRPAPVVVVVFDELSLLALLNREDAIDAVRYPNFAALARAATWYRNATTVSDLTQLAVPAILTGALPDHNRLPTAGDHPRNLFTLLGGTYDLQVVEPVTELCPRDLCPRDAPAAAPPPLPALLADAGLVLAHALAPPALRGSLPDIQRQWTFRFNQWNLGPMVRAASDDRGAVFERFVAAVHPGQRPTLWFLHIMLPHSPYLYLPSGTRYEAPPLLFGSRQRAAHVRTMAEFAAVVGDDLDLDGFAAEDREAARLEELRYLNQLAFVDRLLGDLLAHLRQVGLFDDALLVVTADHGVCLRPGCSARFANQRNLGEIMPVPLFVKAPGQRGGRIDDRNAETIDVLPTIADLLGAPLPWPVDGRSLAAADPAPRAEKVLYTPLRLSNMLDLKRLVAPAERPRRSVGLEHLLAAFGAGTPLAGQAPSDAVAALIDQPLERIARTNVAAPFAVSLYQPERFARVRRASGSLPAFVRGQIAAATPPPPGTPLAIAVNGVVRAVAEVLADDPAAPSFGALVPEPAWRDGVNRVEVFAVETDAGGPRLAPVPTR